MTKPQDRPGSGPLSVSARSWLCGNRSTSASLGVALARLHSVEVGGFYRRHADGRFDFTELAALQAADLANRLDDLRLLSRARLTAA